MVKPKLLPKQGETFFQYRVRRGYKTQADLAKASGVTAGVISRLEDGQETRHPVAALKLKALFGLTDVAMLTLFKASRGAEIKGV